jgi:hypothetical protein
MSGSRGEANFVWKCKSCKVSRRYFTHLKSRTNTFFRENHPQLSRPLLFHMSRSHLLLVRRLLSLTVEGLNLQSLSQK